MIRILLRIGAAALVGILVLLPTLKPTSGSAADHYILKYACFAPEGSTYVRAMRAWDAELRERSNGRLSFRIYAGGVQGDERDMLRKLRVGQLHLLGMTGIGLGEVLPAMRVLELPAYFKDYEEVDIATQAAAPTLTASLREAGYELMGWGEAGTVHLFTKAPVASLKDLSQQTLWAWEGDRISEEIFRVFNIRPLPLSLADVLPSLQSGRIDGVYGSPLAIVALQWAPHIRHMSKQALGRAMGGTIMDGKKFSSLPNDLQALLKETGPKHHQDIVRNARTQNEQSIDTLKSMGVQINPMPPSEWEKITSAAKTVRMNLTGTLWSEELLTGVERAVDIHRQGTAVAPVQ